MKLLIDFLRAIILTGVSDQTDTSFSIDFERLLRYPCYLPTMQIRRHHVLGQYIFACLELRIAGQVMYLQQ